MAKAVVDPQELRRFANNVKQFNDGLQDAMRKLQGQFNALGETWQDQEQAKFAEQFEDTLRMLARFAKTADEQIPYLIRKADRAEEYLRQR